MTVANCLTAQSFGSIEGLVTDPTGGALSNASVSIRNIATGVTRKLLTDGGGRYNAPSLVSGSYEITVEKPGFQTAGKTGISLAVGQTAEAEITLVVGRLQQVVYRRGAVLPSQSFLPSRTAGLVNEQQIKDLPLNGRSYDELLSLNPGIVNYTSQRSGGVGSSNSAIGSMFSASGRRPQESLFLLNGIEFTSASEINLTPGGASGQLLGS